jgi:pyruvate-ferredoxin/flavodoxin oxidoreductase
MRATLDGNGAAASLAYRCNEVCCIYSITPSSPMAEQADEWSSRGQPNVWGTVPSVMEMQSQAGAAGALHGALKGGALATTFTSSQGLLLMIPNRYKTAGELTSMALHVAARSLATIPGIQRCTAEVIIAETGDMSAFPTAGYART